MRFHFLLIVQALTAEFTIARLASTESDGKVTARKLTDDEPQDCDKCAMKTLDPVCGFDGFSYQNSCLAKCQNVAIKSNGECPGDPSMKDESFDTESEVPKSDLDRFKEENYVFVAKRKFQKFVKPTDGYPNALKQVEGENENDVDDNGPITVTRITPEGYQYVTKIDLKNLPEAIGNATSSHPPSVYLDDEPGPRKLQADQRGIVGSDTRHKVCLESCYPYSTIGEFDNAYGDGGCSGTVISPSAVLTAAHCHYNDGVFTDLQIFAPGRHRTYDGEIRNPYGLWKVQFTTFFSKWTQGQDLRYDIAIATFSDIEYRGGDNIGDITGYMGIQATDNDSKELQKATVTGYPYDKPNGEMWTSGSCPGGFQQGYDKVITYHGCDSVKGNDGSGLLDLENKILYGVNVADVPVGPGYPDQSFTNIGVIVHKSNIQLISAVAGISINNWEAREP